MSDIDSNRKIAVILVADVVGYSKHMEHDENSTLQAYSECEKILKQLLNKRNGSIFNTAGDSVLIEFSSAVNAVGFAVDFQTKMIERNKSGNVPTMLEFRIGINMGDVVSRGGNLLGDGVNIAARLEALAQPNGVCISKSIYDFVVPKTKLNFNDLGVQKVKQNSFHAYDVLLDESQRRKIKSEKSWVSRKSLSACISALVILIGVGIYSAGILDTKIEPSLNQKDSTQSDILKVLVRPTSYLSSNENLSYLAPGFTTYLGTALAQHPSLNVSPDTTAKHIQTMNLTDEQIRAEYETDYIVDTTIQVSGEKIRLSVKILDLSTEQTVASEAYEFLEADVFEHQDKIAELALQKMSMMDHSSSSNRRISNDPIIYKKHILAQANMLSWTPEGHHKAMGLIEEILEVEPKNMGIKQMLAWLLQQKVYLGMSEDPNKDLSKSLEIAEVNLKQRDTGIIDAIALASSNEALLGLFEQSCARVPLMNQLLNEKQSKAGPHDYAMTAWINQNCENFEVALLAYKNLFKLSPHYPAWVRYYYAYALLALDNFEEAERYIQENKDLDYSYYGTNEILKLCLVYIAHKQGDFELAAQYFSEFEAMPNSLNLGYLEGDFAAARSKVFFTHFSDILRKYGMS